MKNRSYFAKVVAKSLRRLRGKHRRRQEQKRLNGAKIPPHFATVTSNIRYFSQPGPFFEEQLPAETDVQARARVIAFYLPQFHRFEENDAWWGTGFSEWRNVARGTPRFAGHYQPRIPRDLGFYDLSDDHTMEDQATLAKANGVEAFCFYYYWFDGKRLMEKPVEKFFESSIDHSFCIMWANENWTRTWDGKANDVLISQNYKEEHEDAFILDTARYMKDARYVRVAGRPLFILYRPALLPDAIQTLSRWKEKWTAEVGVTPWVLMVQGFGSDDPQEFGLDGAVEFPPHKISANVPDIDASLEVLDPEFSGLVMDYRTVVEHSLATEVPNFPLIKTASPTWDSDARRPGRGTTLHGSTPALYDKWLRGIIDYATAHPFAEEPVVFINAWNEWAEGAYLEPDVHNGHAYLNTTRRAVYQLHSQANPLLLVGHDSHANGAQMLLLNLARCFQNFHGLDVKVLLLGGGALESDYRSVVHTTLLAELVSGGRSTEQALQNYVREHDFKMAICNTSVTGTTVPILKKCGLSVISLIHEMPEYIRSEKLEPAARSLADSADHMVFPATLVKDGFERVVGSQGDRGVILPQGLYKWFTFDAAARKHIRTELGLDQNAKLIMNAGYADRRKGFDLFVETALRQLELNEDFHFVWVGKIAGDMQRLADKLLNQDDAARIHLVGFTDRMSDYFSASDCLLLTSREDPYPSVVLEAMQIGVPAIVFKGATGFDNILDSLGFVVPHDDAAAMDAALDQALSSNTSKLRAERSDYVSENCKLEDYCGQLLALLEQQDGASTAGDLSDRKGETTNGSARNSTRKSA